MAQYIHVRSDNADFQLLETLRRNRHKRQKTGLFTVEGVRNINAAISNGWKINAFIYDSKRHLSDWATALLRANYAERIFSLSPILMERLSGRDETSELIALVYMRPENYTPSGNTILVFDRPSNKGNLGTIIRSCEAMGVNLLAVTGHAVDIYAPEVVAASMGSFFRLPIVRLPGGAPLISWLNNMRSTLDATIVGTSAHATLPISHLNLHRPVILLLGNEADGLSRALRETCDAIGLIPFVFGCDATSLNVACAASICLYEINRQRECSSSQ